MKKSYDLSELAFLVVDDNTHMLSIIKTLLKGFGIRRIHEATDAADAFEEIRSTHVDIIVLDYALDTLDGIEFAQLVRTAKDSPNPYLPIIMLTAHSERHRVEEARDAGITEFLCKPICATDLYKRIIEVVEHPRSFVKIGTYFGPDRRRRSDENYRGSEKRVADIDPFDALDGMEVDEDVAPKIDAGEESVEEEANSQDQENAVLEIGDDKENEEEENSQADIDAMFA
jgi:two-component system, chemotaxis family, chemotaxis protein CheY